MSGGSTNTTSTQTSSAPSWVQDASKTYLDKANQVSNTPYQASPNQTVGPNATQNTAWNAVQNRAMSGSPTMSAANGTLQDTLQGKYLNSNPYIDQVVNQAQGDVVRNYNNVVRPGQDAAMVRSGSFGNSGLQQQTANSDRNLQQNLGNISTQLRGNNYNTERGNQQAALGFAPTFANQDYTDANQLLQSGNQQNQFAQNNANQNYNWWQEAQNYPTNKLNTFGNALGTVNGTGRTMTSTTPGTSAGAGLLGGGIVGSQLGSGIKDGDGGNYGGWGAALGSLLGLFGR